MNHASDLFAERIVGGSADRRLRVLRHHRLVEDQAEEADFADFGQAAALRDIRPDDVDLAVNDQAAVLPPRVAPYRRDSSSKRGTEGHPPDLLFDECLERGNSDHGGCKDRRNFVVKKAGPTHRRGPIGTGPRSWPCSGLNPPAVWEARRAPAPAGMGPSACCK